MSEENTAETSGISRRRVLVGAAWTAPAIVLATAVPAVAASGPAKFTIAGPVNFTNGGLGGQDRLSVGPLVVSNTGGTAGAPTIRVSFLGISALSGLLAIPTVTGWTGTATLLSLDGGVSLLATWVFVKNQVVNASATDTFSFPEQAVAGSVTSALIGGVRVTVSPPDATGVTEIAD